MMFQCRKRHQAGLTLVELMVTLTISLMLLGGVLKVLANSKQTYRIQEAHSRLQENGRYATQFLSRDIRMADFWGCASVLTSVANNLNPAGAGYIDFVGEGALLGTDGATDSITIRGAFGRGLVVQVPYGPQPSSSFFVDANNFLQQGDIVLITDCVSGDIFQISNANPQNGVIATIVHNTGNVTQPGNFNPGACTGGGNAHCLSKVYQGDASLYRVQEVIYSIANGVSGQPALFRNINQSGAVELVEGVEDMQILYGEDVDGNGAPDGYVNAGAVTNMANVVAVRVTLTLRTLEDNVSLSTQGQDARLRRTFTTTIALRNRLS